LSGFNLSHARIEELVQETFLRTFKNLQSYNEDKGASFSTWVFTIAKRLAINELKRYENRLQKVSEESLEFHPSENTSRQGHYEDNLIEQEKKVSLKKALDKLPEHYRSPLESWNHPVGRYYRQGKSNMVFTFE